MQPIIQKVAYFFNRKSATSQTSKRRTGDIIFSGSVPVNLKGKLLPRDVYGLLLGKDLINVHKEREVGGVKPARRTQRLHGTRHAHGNDKRLSGLRVEG